MNEKWWYETIKHFRPEEFAAPDRPETGLMMNPELVKGLDRIRDLIGYPLYIHHNGGYAFSGHGDGSYHYVGEAADFHFDPNSMFTSREEMKFILSLGLFGGIGFYPEWKPVPGFHVDIRTRFQVWVRRKGQYIYIFE